MKKQMYRISLLEHSEGLADTLAILAAKSNGRDKKYTIQDLQDVVKGQQLLYPSLYDDITCELIGEHILHLDRKIKGSYENILIIEQVEILVLADVPTLTRQDAETILKGINDQSNHELLN